LSQPARSEEEHPFRMGFPANRANAARRRSIRPLALRCFLSAAARWASAQGKLSTNPPGAIRGGSS
jgi:hypothetical protein